MPSRLRVSYFNQRTGKEVSADNPSDMTYRQALRVFRSLMAGSFFALELSPPCVLQLRNEEGAWHTEILNTDARTAVGCLLSWPMAEQALEAVFQGQAIGTFLAEHYDWVRWEAVDMTQADGTEQAMTTTITLPPDIEEAVAAQARLRGVTLEAAVLDALRERFLPKGPAEDEVDSLAEWERLLGAADDHIVASRADD